MTSLDMAAIAVCGIWTAASLCVALRVPTLDRWLMRNDRVRLFARWTMFAAVSKSKTQRARVLEYRDSTTSTEWRVGDTLYHWTPLGFLLNPRRPIVEVLCVRVSEAIEEPDTVQAAWSALTARAMLAAYLQRRLPVPPGAVREIRVVTQPLRHSELPRVLLYIQRTGVTTS